MGYETRIDRAPAPALATRPISADSHVCEPPDCYTRHMDPKFRADAPHVLRDPARGDMFVIKNRPNIPMAFVSGAGRDPKDVGHKFTTYEEFYAGGWEPKARLADQDTDGLAGELLYPSVGMSIGQLEDPDYRHACVWAYNRWLQDFCSYDPSRLVGIGQPAIRTIAEGIKELEQIKAMGHKGIIMPADGKQAQDFHGEMWDPFWEAAADLGLPLGFHIFGGKNDMVARGPEINWWNGVMRGVQDIIGTFIFGGVFERHPKLRLVAVECDAGWVPHYSYRMDHVFNRHRYTKKAVPLSKMPSAYLSENVYFTFQDDWTALRVTHLLNDRRLLWANDFPHNDATWPHSQQLLAEQTRDIPADVTRRILRDNTVELYGLGQAPL
jgi:predicted TIM-barrel fold metal-dependent hydrolase